MDNKVALAAHVAAHTDRIWRIRASHSGDLIASCSADCSIGVWKLAKDLSMHLVQRLQPGGDKSVIVRDCAFSFNDQQLVVAAYDSSIYIYTLVNDLEDKTPFELTAVIGKAHEKEIKSIDVSKMGTVASCSRDRAVSFWKPCEDSPDYDCIGLFQNHTEDIKSVRFSNNGKYLVSSSYDNNICLYERQIEALDELGMDEEERWVFVGGTRSEIDSKSCELNAPDKEIMVSLASCHTVWSSIFTPNSKAIISADGNGCIRYYSISGDEPGAGVKVKQLGCTILHERRPIYDVSTINLGHESAHASRTCIATAGQDGSVGISVVNSVTGITTLLISITGAHDGEVNTICDVSFFAKIPGHAVVCSGGDDGCLNVWRISVAGLDSVV